MIALIPQIVDGDIPRAGIQSTVFPEKMPTFNMWSRYVNRRVLKSAASLMPVKKIYYLTPKQIN